MAHSQWRILPFSEHGSDEGCSVDAVASIRTFEHVPAVLPVAIKFNKVGGEVMPLIEVQFSVEESLLVEPLAGTGRLSGDVAEVRPVEVPRQEIERCVMLATVLNERHD